jgi:hypothetical protein
MKRHRSLFLVLCSAVMLTLPSARVLGAPLRGPHAPGRSGRALQRRPRRFRAYHQALPSSAIRAQNASATGAGNPLDRPRASAFAAPLSPRFPRLFQLLGEPVVPAELYFVAPSRYLLFCTLLI